MSSHPTIRVSQLRDYSGRLAAARDHSYSLAREVERAEVILGKLRRDPAVDPVVCEYATDSLESLCETLVRLCALTDQAAANAVALASLPTHYFDAHDEAASELDTAVASLIDATTTAETELGGLGRIVGEVCRAVDEMSHGHSASH